MAIWNKLISRRDPRTRRPTLSEAVPLVKRPPPLPFEIWRRILSPIVQAPVNGCTNIDFPDPFASTSDPYNHDEFSPSERAAVLRLTEVCRTWRTVILEAMAEYVVVYCLNDIRAVVQRFAQSKKAAVAAGGYGLGIGRLTRRIDFRLHRQGLPESQLKATINSTIRLFELTPNLEIYVNSNGRNSEHPLHTDHRLMDALVRIHGSRLRRVEWNHAECPAWPDLAEFLRGTPNLAALSLTTVYNLHLPLPLGPPIALEHLRHLSLGMPNTAIHFFPRSWSPLLRALSTCPEQLSALAHLDISPFPTPEFFEVHGPKLRTLRTNARDVCKWLPDALECCPNLQTLIFPPTPGIHMLQAHPAIERIGIFPVWETPIEVPSRISDSYALVPLEETLLLVEGMHLPKLKVLRLRNMGALRTVADKSLVMQTWWRRWNIRGVRFEDKMGTSFGDVVTDDDALMALVRA